MRNLKAHIYSTHQEHNECVCMICGKKMKRNSNLKRHLERHHNLTDVGKAFGTGKANLSSEEKHKCKDCGKQFTTKFNLTRHQAVHANASERITHKCLTCLKTFPDRGSLKRHEEGVHKLNIHPCNHCDKTYSRLDSLNAHKAKNHP